jgi:hypothetical protein
MVGVIAQYVQLQARGWKAGVCFPVEARDVFYFTDSRPPLGPTQPPIHWMPSAIFSGVKQTTHLHLVPRPRMLELYLHSPTGLHGVKR